METLEEHPSTGKKSFTDYIGELKPVLHDARYAIGAALAAFVAGVWVGLDQTEYFRQSFKYLEDLAGFLKNQNAVVVILFLFLKNALAAFIVLWAGALLGVVSLFAALQNGVMMGAAISGQASVLFFLLKILPHGVFELPAFFVACGIGIWRGMWLLRKDKRETYKERARKSYLVFFRLILPLLVIAAVIEGSLIAQAK